LRFEITNAAYSTALTYEFVVKYKIKTLGAPTLPSLADAAIYADDSQKSTGTLLFLQYKLGEYLIGNTATLKDQWGIPYYRFAVQPGRKTKKHSLLLGLEGIGHPVFYTAPEFHTMAEFYRCLMQQTLLENSTFWSPEAVGELSKNRRYTAAYKKGVNHGILQPGDKKVDPLVKGEALLGIVKHKLRSASPVVFDDEKLLQFGDQMLENYLNTFHSSRDRNLTGDIRSGRDRLDARDYLSMISILLYDCYVYIVTVPLGQI
jgi:hypothetical protein